MVHKFERYEIWQVKNQISINLPMSNIVYSHDSIVNYIKWY